MSDWQQKFAGLAHGAEGRFDSWKEKLAARLRTRERLVIVPYQGYGRSDHLVLRGRVLRNPGETTAVDNHTLWDNLADMYRRFASDEVPGARVRARFGRARFDAAVQEVTADEEGFFTISLPLAPPLTQAGWQEVALELLHPQGDAPARASGRVFVPPPTARFGVISDLDDTVVVSHATNLLRMAREVFTGSAKTRLPFPGVAAFYRALHQEQNPLVYLSSSPWNLYDLLVDFFTLNNIPQAPIFLRDWGITQTEILPTQHHAHKLGAIRELLAFYPHLPFILIGDSGQHDPEIYAQVVHEHPGRIMAVYIRDVTPDPARDTAVQRLTEEVAAVGCPLLLAADTHTMAQHAVAQGWVAPELLAELAGEI